MENDKKQSALHLYAQTDLNKSQIANMLGIHRHTLSIWIREGDWDCLKNAGDNLPSILAEKVYLMIGHLTDYHLSERRMTDPISHKEADTLYKLALTVAKLRTRSALNESMEMMGHLLQRIQKKDTELATRLAPHIDEYLSEKAHIHTEHLMPEGYTAPGGRIPVPTPQEEANHKKELHLDHEEAFYSDPETVALYQERGIPIPPQYNSLIPESPHTHPSHTHSHTQTPTPFISHSEEPLLTTSPSAERPGGAEHTHTHTQTPTPVISHSEEPLPTSSPLGRPGGAEHTHTHSQTPNPVIAHSEEPLPTSSPSGRPGGAEHPHPLSQNTSSSSDRPKGAENMHKPFRSRKNNKRNASLIAHKAPFPPGVVPSRLKKTH